MKKLFIIPMIALLVSCNCKKAAAEEGSMEKKPLFEVLSESQYQGKEKESYEIIKDQASLEALYQSVNDENIPQIDFAKQRVVAVFLGQRNSGGHSIKVKEVNEKENKIHVMVDKMGPKPGENATMAITNPYSIVKINSTKEIVFNK